MQLLLWTLALTFPWALGARSKRSENAYATIHYEGTLRDAEYVLGIRVLYRSLRESGARQDFVVLASESVSEKTKETFKRDGMIILEISNIENPFKRERRDSFKSHFEFTLNKLHMWAMYDYKRIIYLDADNIALHNLDFLFNCGHFCAVYMNPCFFHTGLMVMTPDKAVYNKLLEGLKVFKSYDGADQGYLTAVFSEAMQTAPLFDSAAPGPLVPGQRLSIGYNFNHMHDYEPGDLELFRVGEFANLSFPAYTVAYPIAPALKPWYWLPYLILGMHWRWDGVRSMIEEGLEWELLGLLGSVIMLLCGCMWLSEKVKHSKLSKFAAATLQKSERWLGARFVQFGIMLVLLTTSFFVTMSVIPKLLPPRYAWPLFVLYKTACEWLVSGRLFTDGFLLLDYRKSMHIVCLLLELVWVIWYPSGIVKATGLALWWCFEFWREAGDTLLRCRSQLQSNAERRI